MPAGLLLRQTRERLGLTYREVEQATYDLASRRGRPEFIIRISRLADIENHGVTPSLHKLYSLSTIYHLDPVQVMAWYEIPIADHFREGANGAGPCTHLAAPPTRLRLPLRFDPGFDPARTANLTRMVESWGYLEPGLQNGHAKYSFAYVGLSDHTMEPLIRRGSLLLVDPGRQKVQNTGWKNEYERPIYFVDVRTGYRCAWCHQDGNRLILQPHSLSSCAPESRRCPEEAEIVGQVVGLAMRLDGS
jgi:transcriptional regulator with XRE-family HTH domain